MTIRTGVLLCLAGLPLAGLADAAHQLEDLTVYARPYGMQSLQHTATPVSILSGEELKNQQSNSIGETLANEPGVSASDFGQGSSRPVIRGLGGQRLQVMQGGISSMDISTISVDHAVSISPFNADQIEILRGPATLLSGNGASAGVVHIVNNRIPETLGEFETDLDYRHNSALGSNTFAARVDGSRDSLAFHADFLTLESNNYEAEVGTIDNSEIDTTDVNIGGSWIGDRGFIGFSLGRYDSVYEVPLDADEPDERVFIDLKQTRVDFAGQLDKPLPGLQTLRLRGAHNDYEHTEFEGPGEPGTFFFNDEWEGRLEAAHVPLGSWSGVLGIQTRLRSFAAVGDEAFVPPAKLNSTGLFVLEDTDHGRWHFEAGARIEFQTIEPTATTGLDEIDHDTYSVSAGALYNLTDSLRAGVNIGRSQRAPALEELLATGPHLATGTFEIGDPNLGEETVNSIDISIERQNDTWSWKLNLFANHIEDFIFQQFEDRNGDGQADEVDETGALGGELLLTRFAQDDALFYGAEFETRYHTVFADRHHMDFRLFADLVRGQLEGGDDLPRITPARVGIGAVYSQGPWRADADIVNVFEQNDTAELETGTGGHILVSAGLGYDFPVGSATGRISLRGANLLDEDARRHTSFIKDRAPLPGRSVMAGLRLTY